MSELFTNGGIFGVILVVMIIEACVLIPYQRLTGRGIAPLDLLLTLASGGSLLLAIGAVLLQAPLACIGLALSLALIAHLADLGHRWRNSARQPAAKNELNNYSRLQSQSRAAATGQEPVKQSV